MSERIAERLGLQLGDAALGKFSNGEKSVEIRNLPLYEEGGADDGRLFSEESGCFYCAIGIGNVCAFTRESVLMGYRINDHIMELLILISACKMGSAKRITGMLRLWRRED